MIDNKQIAILSTKANLIEKIITGQNCELEMDNYFDSLEIQGVYPIIDELFNICLGCLRDSKTAEDFSIEYMEYLENIFKHTANGDNEYLSVFYSQFLKHMIVDINQAELEVEVKYNLIAALDRNAVSDISNVKKLYLSTFLNLLMAKMPIDVSMLRSINAELTILLERQGI